MVPHVVLRVCPHLGMKIVLVDKSEETGRFEIMPCTQHGADPEFHGGYDEVLEAGDFPNGRHRNVREGTGWARTRAPSTAAPGTDRSIRAQSW